LQVVLGLVTRLLVTALLLLLLVMMMSWRRLW
jgi:hypothetical protein